MNSENGKMSPYRRQILTSLSHPHLGALVLFPMVDWCISQIFFEDRLGILYRDGKGKAVVAAGASDVEAAIASDLLFVLRSIHGLQRLNISFLGRYSEYTVGNAVRKGDVECSGSDCDSEKREAVKNALTSKTLGSKLFIGALSCSGNGNGGRMLTMLFMELYTLCYCSVCTVSAASSTPAAKKHGTNNSNPLFLNHMDTLHNISGDMSKQSLEMIRLILCDVCPHVIHTLFPDGFDGNACSPPMSSFDHVVEDARENEKANTQCGLSVPLPTESQPPTKSHQSNVWSQMQEQQMHRLVLFVCD